MPRNRALDIAKGIGICLVVLGHNLYLTKGIAGEEVAEAIFSFHVPLFFFISGVFLKPTVPLRDFVISRGDVLLKPYFVVLGVLGIVKICAGWPIPTLFGLPEPANYFLGLLYGTGPTIAWGALWFLPHLYITSLSALLILKATGCWPEAGRWLVATFLLVLGTLGIDRFWSELPVQLGSLKLDRLPGLPWSIDLVPVTCSFVIIGSLLRTSVQSMSFHFPAFFCSCAIFTCLHWQFDELIDLNRRHFGSFSISTAQAALGIYLTLAAASALSKRSMAGTIESIGAGSMFILIFHTPIQRKTAYFMSSLLMNDIAGGIVGFVAGVAIPLLLWELARLRRRREAKIPLRASDAAVS